MRYSKVENHLEDILNRNNIVMSQMDSLIKYKSATSRDIDHFERLLKETENEIIKVESLIQSAEESLQERYIKLLNREKENHKQNSKKFEDLKAIFNGSTGGSDYNSLVNQKNIENSGLLQDVEQYKVNTKDIKFMQDISKFREDKMKDINEKIYLVDKCSKDMQFLTEKGNKQIDNIIDNVTSTLEHQNEAHEVLVKTNKEEQDYKENKCCVILLIVVSIVFLL
eukprot:CAMPEP_0170528344 /NCGR_PEP_ID=MMETSP0209-20121228/13849_1 /TAXON_ID=665100 ORGANISM="Litonotus pictus, Strain P1" /NCGR_SAMPLE_ID=MMETSP0209 /ASSEMBLY_ACC=CAM_ASM_000301 /LENGTH=224 /DNA_ID=CAMNT_0010819499 /DNA_START=56 /DNA_END=726 /DNA_ORIENTATION=-